MLLKVKMKNPFWVASDCHWYHTNIIKYCQRPFTNEGDLDDSGNWISEEVAQKSTELMNETMFNNWQSLIGEKDKVFFLGDWVIGAENKYKTGQILHDQLHGRKIFIQGNHDEHIHRFTNIRVIDGTIQVSYKGLNFMMSHEPIWEHSPDIDIYICGHIHNNEENERLLPNMINVSMEMTDYKPVHIDAIIEKVGVQHD